MAEAITSLKESMQIKGKPHLGKRLKSTLINRYGWRSGRELSNVIRYRITPGAGVIPGSPSNYIRPQTDVLELSILLIYVSYLSRRISRQDLWNVAINA